MGPTPAGVPVAITSPGSRVMDAVMKAMISGTLVISRLVLLCCTTSPFSRVRMSRLAGSTSSVTTGPMGAKPSMFLPRAHCPSDFCTSRAVTSLRQVKPRT